MAQKEAELNAAALAERDATLSAQKTAAAQQLAQQRAELQAEYDAKQVCFSIGLKVKLIFFFFFVECGRESA